MRLQRHARRAGGTGDRRAPEPVGRRLEDEALLQRCVRYPVPLEQRAAWIAGRLTIGVSNKKFPKLRVIWLSQTRNTPRSPRLSKLLPGRCDNVLGGKAEFAL